MGPANLRQVLVFITVACCCILAECGEGSRKRMEQEELDRQRFKQPFAYIFFSVTLAVSLPLFRFFHCLFTDPLMPPLFKELKRRAVRILETRFGSIGVEKRVDIDVDIDIDIDDINDEYIDFTSID